MYKKNLAPIVLFVYNRPKHTELTLSALMQNELAESSTLFIYADGAKENATSSTFKDIDEVRKIIHSRQWCKEVQIIEGAVNKGLANSVIDGVSEIINKYGKVIVLEDDLVTSRYFLQFMNEALNFYELDERIFSVGGVNYIFPIPQQYKNDVYIVHRTESWGWATWSNRWAKADWCQKEYDHLFLAKNEIKKFNRGGNDLIKLLQLQIEGKIDSWAIRWDYVHYINDAYCLRPIKSFVQNIGFDGSGMHCDNINGTFYSGIPYNKSYYEIKFVNEIKADKNIEENFKLFFGGNNNYFTKMTTKIKEIIIKGVRKIKKFKFMKSFISLSKVTPVSQIFGLDRGTPIDRLYIEQFLESHKVDICRNVLEVAESTYSKKFGQNVKNYQILHFDTSNNETTLVGDLSNPNSLPANIYDSFICTQTLNFIYDVKSAIIGSHKLLVEGGVFLGTVAGLSQISRYDMDRWGDYWRFTDLSIKKMFEEVFGEGHVEIQVYGNALAATAFIQGLAVEEMPSVKKLMRVDENYQIIIGIRAVK